jgi:hypothetical protein
MPRKPAKKKSPSKPKKKKAATPNGKLIQDLMAGNRVKGSYKDFVAIAGNRIIDWIDSYEAYRPNGEPVGVEGVALIHKRALHDIFGEAFASKFWNRALRMRVHPTQIQRNPNMARSHGAR